MSGPGRVGPGNGEKSGQWTARKYSDTGVGLTEQFPPPVSQGAGRWEVSDTVAEELESDGSAFRRTAMHVGGQPHRAVRNNAAAALIAEVEDHDVTANKLRVLCTGGQPMTTLVVDRSGSVSAQEIRGFPTGDDRLAYQRKGASKKAYVLNSDAVLTVEPGYGKQNMVAAEFHQRLAQTPATAPVDFDGVPDVEAAAAASDTHLPPPSDIAAAYLVTNPDFEGGEVAGCMFLATDYDRDNDIVNGYLWAPGSSSLTSEHGSMYGADLARRGGRITDYPPGHLSFGDCVNDGIPPSRSEAYRCVTGQSFYPE